MSFSYIENSTESFSTGTLSGTMSYDNTLSMAGQATYINGILVGILRGDIGFIPDWFAGVANEYELGVTGSYFIDCFGNYREIVPNSGIYMIDSTTYTGYVMYSVATTQSRFGANAATSAHLICVRYYSGSWQYDNNSSFVNFTTTSGDCLVASLTWGPSNISTLYCGTSYGERTNQVLVTNSGTYCGNLEVAYSGIRGLYFGGSGFYVSLPITGVFRNNLHTIEVFFRSTTNGTTLFARGAVGESVATNVFEYRLYTTYLYISIETGSGVDHSYNISLLNNYLDDALHHCAIVSEGNKVIVYIDGVYNGQVSVIMSDSTAPIYTGWNGNTAYFYGIIEEYRVRDTNRSYSEILATASGALVGNEEGLIAYYKCDQKSGTSLIDSSINGYHGTITGCKWSELHVEVRSSEDGETWSDFERICGRSKKLSIPSAYGKSTFLVEYKQILSTDYYFIYQPDLTSFSITTEDAYKFSGTVTEDNMPMSLSGSQLSLYHRDTNVLVSSGYTTTSGTFELFSPYSDYHYLVALHQEMEYNALIYDWLSPLGII